jgi:hypothetical protein
MAENFEYKLTIDLNTLNHLGIGLYSNVPAVISEVVANSWDADADKVEINIDVTNQCISISDDGCGMNENECNDKYLKVGFSKREKEYKITPIHLRHVFGRKGIGKLSLFSIADEIEVHSVKLNEKKEIISKAGFIMRTADIKKHIENQSLKSKEMHEEKKQKDDQENVIDESYHPQPVPKENIKILKGTTIILRKLRKNVARLEEHLKPKLARRFSVIGKENQFEVLVGGKAITFEDCDYFKKIEYLWMIGDGSDRYEALCVNKKRFDKIDGTIDKDKNYIISGWVGTFDEQKSIDEGNNTIVVQAWGKLIHEDILKDLSEGGVFTKYLIGEIRADFVDYDNDHDMATSGRQALSEDDPRFDLLKEHIRKTILKTIQSKWRDWRNEDSEKKALMNPVIKQWFETLKKDNRGYAKKLFRSIESLPMPDPRSKNELYKQSILAFETLALKGNLEALSELSDSFTADKFHSIFNGLDDLEAAHYYQIVKGRFAVLKTFENIVQQEKERVIQSHIFKHLWLLDPSWERAATDERIEERIIAELSGVQVKGRLDISYKTAAGRHIVIELKKYDVKVSIYDLVEQVGRYSDILRTNLARVFPAGEIPPIDIICILGDKPTPVERDEENRKLLEVKKARYITYDELIFQTRNSYREYLDSQKKITELTSLLGKLDNPPPEVSKS